MNQQQYQQLIAFVKSRIVHSNNQMNLGMIFSLIHPNPNSIHSNSYKSLSNKFVTLPNNSKVEVSAIGAYH